MSFLGQLVDDASGDGVPVATLLRKVKVVAARLGNMALEEWVDYELTGYPTRADLPDYRAARHVEVQGHFSGPFGSSVQNASIPRLNFPEDYRDGPLFTVEFREPIAALEQLAQGDDSIRSMWPADAVVWVNMLLRNDRLHLYENMGLQQAFRLIPRHPIAGIIDTVKTRILNLALALEAVAPDAGQPHATASDQAALERVVMNVYGGNVAVQSSHFRQEILMPAVGDIKALFVALDAAGISEENQADLRVALNADAEEGAVPGKPIGRRVKEWAGRMALAAPGAAGKGAAGTAGGLAIKALASYFGVES